MKIQIRAYQTADAADAGEIWNQVVRDGDAFPQENELTPEEADSFFKEQTYTGIAVDADTGTIVGLYILHPNNVGRCGHIANASFAVKKDIRGEHIGEKIVKDCLKIGREKGYRILQFNAVVASNIHALHLYKRLGFEELGTIPGGFHMPDDSYEDIILFYHEL